MKKPKRTLKDVDGTVPGRAALVYVDLNDPDSRWGLMRTDYLEGDHGCDDPILSCEALHESIKGDWTGHEYTIVANHRAKYLKWRRDMIAVLGEPGRYTPEYYLENR